MDFIEGREEKVKQNNFLELLLQSGLNPSQSYGKLKGSILVYAIYGLAVEHGHFQDAMKLIQYGADVNASSYDLKLALTYCFQFSPTYFSPTFIYLLVDACVNVNEHYNSDFFEDSERMENYKCLFDFLNTNLKSPRSLLLQCRYQIRKCVHLSGTNLLARIDLLTGILPVSLLNFVKMKEMENELTDVKRLEYVTYDEKIM